MRRVQFYLLMFFAYVSQHYFKLLYSAEMLAIAAVVKGYSLSVQLGLLRRVHACNWRAGALQRLHGVAVITDPPRPATDIDRHISLHLVLLADQHGSCLSRRRRGHLM